MANYCNKICNDYYCEMNAKGRCHAPNPCLGHEEAAELISELKAAKREIEALRKRERGDCAKLREALETLRELLGDLLRLEDAEYHNDFSNFCDIIDAALAAPPRNCDRFGGDNAKLQKVYYSECGKKYDPQDPISRQTYLVGYGNWLLALAKEGGAK